MKIEIFQVDNDILDETIDKLARNSEYGFDTETFGKNFSDRMFSLAIATGDQAYYFNFYDGYDHLGDKPDSEFILDKKVIPKLAPLFSNGVWYSHNAKFDLLMLRKEGLDVSARVRCTAITERLLINNLPSYRLEEIAKKYGMEKDMRVQEYMDAHNLYEKKYFEGEVYETVPLFYKVPYNLLCLYAPQDAWLHLKIGQKQYAEILRRSDQ